jgi:hypothetical protein
VVTRPEIGVNTDPIDLPSVADDTDLPDSNSLNESTISESPSKLSDRLRVKRPSVDRRDPIMAARSLVQSATQLSQTAGGQTSDAIKRLERSVNAFDAYALAAGRADEAHVTLMRELRDAQRNLEESAGTLRQLTATNEELRSYLTKIGTAYDRAQKRLRDLENRDAQQTVTLESELLHSLSAEPDPSLPPEVSALAAMQSISAALEMLSSLGLTDNGVIDEQRDALIQRVEAVKRKLTDGTSLLPGEVETLTHDAQAFLSGLKPDAIARPESEAHEDGVALNADLARVTKARDELADQVKAAKAEQTSLKQEVLRLTNALAAERDIMAGDRERFQAQMKTVRAALDTTGLSPKDANAKLKKQILDMQALMEVSTAERDVFRDRAAASEAALRDSEAMVSELNKVLERQGPGHQEKSMFHDADIEKLREERQADAAMVEQQRQHIEVAMGQNNALRERCAALDQQILQLKRELRAAVQRSDDLTMGITLSPSTVQPKAHPAHVDEKLIQCSLIGTALPARERTPKKRVEFVSVEVSPKVEEEPAVSSSPPSSPTKLLAEEASDDDEPIMMPLDALEDPGPLARPLISTGGPDIPRRPHTAVLVPLSKRSPADPLSEPTEDDYNDGLVGLSGESYYKNNGDDLAPRVPQPLVLKMKKPKISMPPEGRARTQTSRPARPVHMRRTQPASPPEPEELSINGAPQGRRSLTGATVVARPATASTERHAVPPPPEIPAVQVNALAAGPPPTPLSRRERPHLEYREPLPIDKTLEQETPVPIRITLVAPQEPEKKERPVIVSASASGEASSKMGPIPPRSLTQLLWTHALPPLQPPELREARTLIVRLKDQLRKALEKSEQSEVEVVELRQKISELTLLIHRLRLDNIKQRDDVTRKTISYDHVKQRLDICIKEIAMQDDELSRLRKEIAALKRQQAPVNESLLKLRGAEAEKARLEREQQRRLEMAAVAENAKRKASSEEVRNHMDLIISRQRQTVAKLEAQRRMWTEIERKHIMGVLAAMSLLSTSQVKIVREVLPEYSPFAASKVRVLREVLARSKAEREMPDLAVAPKKGWAARPLTYGEKVERIDRVVDPPLTDAEKRLVIRDREPPEIAEKLMKVAEQDEKDSELDGGELSVKRLAVTSFQANDPVGT